MGGQPRDASDAPAAHPEPGRNPGYAERQPGNKKESRIPGARQPPGDEEGGLEHAPDPAT
jgi:hypothetical protein